MGFWRGVGYFINIIWIIACLILPYGIFFIIIPIVLIVILHRGAVREKRHNELIDTIEDERYERRKIYHDERMKSLEDKEDLK